MFLHQELSVKLWVAIANHNLVLDDELLKFFRLIFTKEYFNYLRIKVWNGQVGKDLILKQVFHIIKAF